MKELTLTNSNRKVLLDDEDFVVYSKWKWNLSDSKKGYARRIVWNKGKPIRIYMHKEILKAPMGFQVDHIDCNKLNNQRSNLRVATKSQNSANYPPRGKTGYRGVRVGLYGKFPVYLCKEGRIMYGGTYSSAEEAAVAANKVAVELHGEFAWRNKV